MRRTRGRGRLFGWVSLGLILSGPARALECAADAVARVGNAPFLCADTFSRATAQGVLGSNSTSGSTFYLNLIGGVADNLSTADGGLSGSAVATADWGVLDAAAGANNGPFTTPGAFPESRVVSIAEAGFADRGVVTSASLPIGTPVDLLSAAGAKRRATRGTAACPPVALSAVGSAD